jgi:hypothetical protein
MKVDPDTRSLRSLMKDDRREGVALRSLMQDDKEEAIELFQSETDVGLSFET